MATTQNRRSTSSSSSSTSGAVSKRHVATSSVNLTKAAKVIPSQHKKREALANITNQRNGPSFPPRNSLFDSSKIVPCSARIVSIKKGPCSVGNNVGLSRPNSLPGGASTSVKPSFDASSKNESVSRTDVTLPKITVPPAPYIIDMSPSWSAGSLVSMDESMSTYDSLNSPEFEYIDNNEIAAVESIERQTSNKLCISENLEATGKLCKRNMLLEMDPNDLIVDIDKNLMDPQLCATMACDIYKHLRAYETKKRPSADFMERVQKDINASMRAILIDWLVEAAEEYRLVPETLYLTVYCIDKYLSGNVMDRQKLQLLGVACMMIASKYEEICAPQVEEFCYITDNTNVREEVLQMEASVLSYLKFEVTAPTVKCFLGRFVRAAQGADEAQSLQLEHLASYIAELSLLEYSMLCYAPSLIAASAIFLAKYILSPSRRPWNSTLHHYTLYKQYDLHECVVALHGLCCNSQNSNLPAVREKYSQHKYKFVAKKYIPSSIPPEYFQDICN